MIFPIIHDIHELNKYSEYIKTQTRQSRFPKCLKENKITTKHNVFYQDAEYTLAFWILPILKDECAKLISSILNASSDRAQEIWHLVQKHFVQ